MPDLNLYIAKIEEHLHDLEIDKEALRRINIHLHALIAAKNTFKHQSNILEILNDLKRFSIAVSMLSVRKACLMANNPKGR